MMLRLVLLATLAVTTVFASGEFVVLHSPKNVKFEGNEQIDHNVLKDVFKALLGITIKPGSWSGIRTNAPFDLPKAIVVVAVEGVQHLESRNGKVYPLNDLDVEEILWQAVSGILQGRGKVNKLVRMRMADGLEALGESALGTLKPNPIDESTLQLLKFEDEKVRRVLEEIKLLDAIARHGPLEISVNEKPDVYWLVVSGLRPLVESNCNNSPAVKEALALLNDAISNVTKAFMTAYKDQVVITAFTNGTNKECNSNLSRQRRAEPTVDDSDKNVTASENTSTAPVIDSAKNDEEEIERNEDEEEKTRTITEGSSLEKLDENPSMTESYESRSENTEKEADETRESSTRKSSLGLDNSTRNNEQSNTDTENTNRPLKDDDLNHAKKYNANYPVIFNIFLWFGVAFFFSLLAVCITIADMDPGRDSIIYRMTSTRMKKDN